MGFKGEVLDAYAILLNMKKLAMQGRDGALLAGCLLIAFAAAAIGSFFTLPEIPTWYASLAKPWFTPPNWLFGPVWTILYALQGIALYLVARKKAQYKALAVTVFMLQLILNVGWSIIFFGMHQLSLALITIVLLLFMIAVTIRTFAQMDRLAGRLLWPYAAWVCFATALTLGILVINK